MTKRRKSFDLTLTTERQGAAMIGVESFIKGNIEGIQNFVKYF